MEEQKSHPHFSSWPLAVAVLAVVFFIGYAFGMQRGGTIPPAPAPADAPTASAVPEGETPVDLEVYRNPFEGSTNPFQ